MAWWRYRKTQTARRLELPGSFPIPGCESKPTAGHYMTKKLLISLAMSMMSFASISKAAISIGPAGSGVLGLDAPPAASEWATLAVAGTHTSWNNLTAMEGAVLPLDQSAIATTLPTSATTPPSTSAAGFRYNTTLHLIQSRPTGVAGLILKATLQNDTGGSVSALTISYDFGMQSPPASVGELPGHYVYWSLTGAPNTWTRVDALSGSEVPGNRTGSIPVGAWNPGSLMYILWVDDNDDPNTDPSYTIDNVTITTGIANFVTVTAPTNTASFPLDFPITVSAAAAMPNPVTSVSFFENGNLLGSDTSSPYSFTWSGATVGSHTITATATDGTTTINSTNTVVISVHANTPPVISAVTNDTAVSNALVGTIHTYTAVAADDGAITNVDFLLDGAHRWSDTTSPYQFAWCDVTAGNHTLTVIASDNSGLTATNTTSLLVTNPPDVDVVLANGSSWKYWDEGVDPGPGWQEKIYNDQTWSNGVAEIGYGDVDANRPEITVSRKYIGVPGDPNTITNATQLFRNYFNVSNPSSWTGMVVRLMADDAGIVYINGTEVYRNTNLPAVVTYATPAPSTMPDDGVFFNETNFPTSLLVAGENTVAVEIHQNGPGSSDISFDLMIWGQKPPAPTLTFTPVGDGTYRLSWPGGMPQFCIQYKEKITDVWQDLFICHPVDNRPDLDPPDADGRYSFNVNPALFGSQEFFRLAPPGN
jgi:hypothetical protein